MLKETRVAADREYQRLENEKEQIRSSLTARLREKESKCIRRERERERGRERGIGGDEGVRE